MKSIKKHTCMLGGRKQLKEPEGIGVAKRSSEEKAQGGGTVKIGKKLTRRRYDPS